MRDVKSKRQWHWHLNCNTKALLSRIKNTCILRGWNPSWSRLWWCIKMRSFVPNLCLFYFATIIYRRCSSQGRWFENSIHVHLFMRIARNTLCDTHTCKYVYDANDYGYIAQYFMCNKTRTIIPVLIPSTWGLFYQQSLAKPTLRLGHR